MKVLFVPLAALALSGSAFAHDSKSSKGSEPEEMDCDHPAEKQSTAPVKPDAQGIIVRGEKIDRAPTVKLAELLRSPEGQNGKAVVVEGKVRRACERMGCWMELAETGQGPGVRVTFKDYGFFVPVDSAGASAKVAGTVKVVDLSAASAAHYESEGGRIAKDTKGRRREVQLLATGVELRR